MVALGMRRPERLLLLEALLPLPTEADFGTNTLVSRYTTVARKKKTVKLFLLLCKLSIIMEDIVVFQRSVRYSQLWDAENRELTLQEIELVAGLERRLKSWKEDLNSAVINRAKQRCTRDRFPMLYVLQIMGE
jgi:hypothetical protein